MNKPDEKLVERAKALFDESADGLDAATVSKLNRIRHEALEAAGSRRSARLRWVPVTGAAVAVPYRDGWYFIDETDQATKRFFRLLSALWSVSIAEGTTHAAAPVLTVPVSR